MLNVKWQAELCKKMQKKASQTGMAGGVTTKLECKIFIIMPSDTSPTQKYSCLLLEEASSSHSTPTQKLQGIIFLALKHDTRFHHIICV